MKVDRFVLCEFTTRDPANQSVPHNLVREITATTALPAVSGAVVVSTSVSFSRKERGRHRVAIEILGPDGKEAYDTYALEAEVPADTKADTTPISFDMERVHLRINSLGRYQMNLRVDKKIVANWEFQVVPVQ